MFFQFPLIVSLLVALLSLRVPIFQLRLMYSGDLQHPDSALHAVFVGSPCAAGELTKVDASQAEQMDGVVGVLRIHCYGRFQVKGNVRP